MKYNAIPPDEKRIIQTPTNGFIPILGISGPIPFPIEVVSRKVYNLVQQGYVVYETSKKTGKRIRLTLQNCNRKDRFGEDEAHLESAVLNDGKLRLEYTKEEPEVSTEDYGEPVTLTEVKEPDIPVMTLDDSMDEDEQPCLPPEEPELKSRAENRPLMVNGKVNDFIPPPKPPQPEPKKENPNIIYYNNEEENDEKPVQEEKVAVEEKPITSNNNNTYTNNRKKKRR